MSNPNRYVPFTNYNSSGFVHSTTTGLDHSCKDPISSGCTAPPQGSSVTQRWPRSQVHAPTPTVAVSAAARSGMIPCVRADNPPTCPTAENLRGRADLCAVPCRKAGEPEVRTEIQSFEHRAFQSRSLSNAATGPNAFYLHPEVGLVHRSNGMKDEAKLCKGAVDQTARAETGEVHGDVLGGTSSLVHEVAAADRSVRGAAIEHWQGSSGTGRFGQRAMYEALRTSTLY